MNCVPLQNARDNAFDAGVNTINALWIDDRDFLVTTQPIRLTR